MPNMYVEQFRFSPVGHNGRSLCELIRIFNLLHYNHSPVLFIQRKETLYPIESVIYGDGEFKIVYAADSSAINFFEKYKHNIELMCYGEHYEKHTGKNTKIAVVERFSLSFIDIPLPDVFIVGLSQRKRVIDHIGDMCKGMLLSIKKFLGR